jgi:sugar-specific transcriptional regulator TrmB
LKDYLLKGYSISNRVFRIEEDIYSLKERVDKIDLQISADQLPKQGIFFEGQVFDAYNFVSDLFRKAEKSIVIVDNYVDDTVLLHLTKIKKGVQVMIITKSISDQFKLDIKRFEEQYFTVEVKASKSIHDRFIIIDGEVLYHLGASLKDLGKKLFGFTKMDKAALNLIEEIGKI